MTELKFTTNVTDKNTGELYLKNETKSFDDGRAKELIDAGVAEVVTPAKVKPETKEEKQF